jgi:YHS domain-containing protein
MTLEESFMLALSRRRFVAVVLALFSSLALAGDFFEKDGVALRGYDPVSYFKANQPQLGTAEHSHVYQGSTFYFASADNKKLFIDNPEQYVPQFGGYCAFGASQGYKVSTQPDAYAVVNGKLYLNYNAGAQKIWQQDTAGYIATAEKKWPEVSKTKPKD